MFIPDYGICYTFNGTVSQTLPGDGNGLSVLIDIDQQEYTETYKRGNHEAGLKFVVHQRRDPPLVDTLGLAVPPGFHTYAAKNLVYLDIFYDELSVTKFKQVPAMTWSALLADLGGQMGLFLGVSAITAAEVVEYLMRKIYRLCRGGQVDNKVTESVET